MRIERLSFSNICCALLYAATQVISLRESKQTRTIDIPLYAPLFLLVSERVPEELSGDGIQACCLEVEHAREGERVMNAMLSQWRNFFPARSMDERRFEDSLGGSDGVIFMDENAGR